MRVHAHAHAIVSLRLQLTLTHHATEETHQDMAQCHTTALKLPLLVVTAITRP
jgi:hypothetical protein